MTIAEVEVLLEPGFHVNGKGQFGVIDVCCNALSANSKIDLESRTRVADARDLADALNPLVAVVTVIVTYSGSNGFVPLEKQRAALVLVVVLVSRLRSGNRCRRHR